MAKDLFTLLHLENQKFELHGNLKYVVIRNCLTFHQVDSPIWTFIILMGIKNYISLLIM